MAEQKGEVGQEAVGKSGKSARRAFLKGVAATAGLVMAGIKSVSAEGTPLPTVTPDDLDKKIVAADATITALSKERLIAQKGATQTAIVGEIEDIKNPKTATPTATATATTTPTSTPTFTNEQIDIKTKAGIWPSTTPSPTPTQILTSTPPPEGGILGIDNPFKEKGFPVTEAAGVAAVIAAIAANFLGPVRGPVRNFEGRIIRGIWNRIRHTPPAPPAGGAGAAPAAGAP